MKREMSTYMKREMSTTTKSHIIFISHLIHLIDGTIVNVCKGTAEDFNLGTTLADGVSPNIAGMEHLRSFIQVNCNNLLVTCLGTTIPVDWFLDGTIQWRILNHWQTNGAEIAFQIEGDLISFMEVSPKHHFGVHYTNQGRYRGNGGVTGVHNVVVIALLNFEQLLREKMVGYSLTIRKSKLDEMMLHQHPNLHHLVELSDEKKAVIKKRTAYRQSRYAIRRARAKQAEEEEEEEEEDGDYLVSDEGWTYEKEEVEEDGGGKPAAVRRSKKRGQGEEVDELQFPDRPSLMVNRDKGGRKKRATPKDDEGDGKPAVSETKSSRKKRAPVGKKKQANKVSVSPQQAAHSRRSATTKPSYADIDSEDSDSDYNDNKEN